MKITFAASAPSKREARKLDRRQAIIDAARQSFLENGYAGTSMSGLLKTLGGSKATLWSYFRSKEDLFAAVIGDLSGSFRAQLEDVLSSHSDLQRALVTFCQTFLEKIASPEALSTWRLVVAESGRFPEVGKIFYEQAASHTHTLLRDFISRQIQNGKLANEDPARMADTLINLCVGEHTRLLWGLPSPTSEELNDNAESFARWFLKAYALA